MENTNTHAARGTTTTDTVTVYTFTVWVTVPMDTDGDGTPDYPTYTAQEIAQQLARGFRKLDGDVDYELMDTEVKVSE